MVMETFPETAPTSVGNFWLAAGLAPDPADDPEADVPDASWPPESRVGGLCRVEDGLIEVDVPGELTPGTRVTVHDGESRIRPRTEVQDFTVHGNLPVKPWAVSLLDCHTIRRQGNALSPLAGGDHTHQVVRALWAVTGAYVTSATRYTGVSVSVEGLEEWAISDALEQTLATGPADTTTISWTSPETREVPFTAFHQTATLACESRAQFGGADVHGGWIRATERLALTGLTGWTLDEAVSNYVIPIQSLMTQLLGRVAHVSRLAVEADGRWLQVYGPHVDHKPAEEAATGSTASLLLDSRGLSLEHVARWCSLTADLSPVVQVVAAAVSREFVTMETEALTMVTTAEALDRRLNRGERLFESETLDEARESLEAASIEPALRERLISSLGYMHEASMPQRVLRLADSVARAAPDCVGRANRWKRAVVSIRNGGAHGLEASGADDLRAGLPDAYYVTRSLRWALRVRLLQLCGVDDATINEALADSNEYRRDRVMWTANVPTVFGPS
ncbi:HEPN domain-containing protein [uncultured Nocardioides sp.]|uniref:HEPN domain-containing protein n=1 Tax=uncultured Nocardioides sp. TaxID=198441 RepID=UPI00262E9DB6|nr:HEPN domain-containing protein [uncultured Nocardioides sp.]